MKFQQWNLRPETEKKKNRWELSTGRKFFLRLQKAKGREKEVALEEPQ